MNLLFRPKSCRLQARCSSPRRRDEEGSHFDSLFHYTSFYKRSSSPCNIRSLQMLILESTLMELLEELGSSFAYPPCCPGIVSRFSWIFVIVLMLRPMKPQVSLELPRCPVNTI